MKDIKVSYEPPNPQEYIDLRVASGLSPKSLGGATIGLKNSYHSVALYNGTVLIGFGRIIGDGGTAFQITDVAVLPDFQGKGYGKKIMSELTEYIKEHAPQYSYISLIADGPADRLYEKFGFKDVGGHGSKGMYLWLK